MLVTERTATDTLLAVFPSNRQAVIGSRCSSVWPLTPHLFPPSTLQAVIEKSVIFGLATGTRKGSAALSDLVTAYASLLASQVRRWVGSDAGGEAVRRGLRQ